MLSNLTKVNQLLWWSQRIQSLLPDSDSSVLNHDVLMSSLRVQPISTISTCDTCAILFASQEKKKTFQIARLNEGNVHEDTTSFLVEHWISSALDSYKVC